MGKKDDVMVVVDSRARVIGVDGLRVVDASAFRLCL
jgi:choline dehydrogenase-like flavoprotein